MDQDSEQRRIDRTGWPAGPWDGEPDRDEWRHAGFPCLVLRNRSGAWCGYVGLPPGHPMHGVGYDDVRVTPTADDDDAWPNVHGGLTYSEKCSGGICHVPRPGESDDVWWLGFDCVHSGDIAPRHLLIEPSMPAHLRRDYHGEVDGVPSWPVDSYKTIGYARRETERLADQLARPIP